MDNINKLSNKEIIDEIINQLIIIQNLCDEN